MGGIGNSWAIAKASWLVLMEERGLLLFPVLSAVCTLFATALFIVPTAVLFNRQTRSDASLGAAHIALLFIVYLVAAFITLFFNTAMVSMAIERLRGNDPRVQDGLRVAMENLGGIFGFALVSATVGVALRLIGEKFGFIGSLVASLLGAGWSVITFLVVPIMVVEKRGPFPAIGRSKELLGATWGAQLAGNLGIGWVVFLLGLLGVIPVGLALAIQVPLLMAVLVGVAVIYWVLLAVVSSAMGQIYRAAVYLYAGSSLVAPQYDSWMLERAFRQR